MTDEQIKDLAQSYVDELFAHDDMQDQENIEAKNDAFVMCMAFAGHIMETHCIVEKDKIRAIYNRKTIPSMEDVRNKMIEECLIDALFGKELFNGKEE